MGIDKSRFKFINIEVFQCVICKDLAVDPILINDCEHYLCRSCVPTDLEKCPTCGSKYAGYHDISLALKRVYLNLKLKCANVSCKEELTVENYNSHEQICPKGFYECPQSCGFKIEILVERDIHQHNCINYLRQETDRLNNKIVIMELNNQELETRIDVLQNNVIGKRRVSCGLILQRGEHFYRCFTCQHAQMSVICVQCFQNGNHNDHRFELKRSENDICYCDCGDLQMLKEGAACPIHQH